MEVAHFVSDSVWVAVVLPVVGRCSLCPVVRGEDDGLVEEDDWSCCVTAAEVEGGDSSEEEAWNFPKVALTEEEVVPSYAIPPFYSYVYNVYCDDKSLSQCLK